MTGSCSFPFQNQAAWPEANKMADLGLVEIQNQGQLLSVSIPDPTPTNIDNIVISNVL